MKFHCSLFIFSLVYFFIAEADNVETGNFQVTARVDKFCTVQSTPFTFGKYKAKELTARAVVTVTCTAGTVFYLGVAHNNIAMLNKGEDTLSYFVYSDINRSQILSADRDGKHSISGIGTGKPQNITLYATIRGAQVINKGDYLGKLIITLSF